MLVFLIALGIVFLIALILLFLVGLAFLGYVSRRKQFKLFEPLMRKVSGAVDNDEKYAVFGNEADKKLAEIKSRHSESLEILSKDKLKLKARLIKSERKGGGKLLIIACHGARSCGIEEFAFWSSFYDRMGADMLLVDHRACGESQGKYMTYGRLEAEDTMIWLDSMIKCYGKEVKILLHGISLGAATVLIMSGKTLPSQVIGVVSECSYTSAYEEFKYQLTSSLHLPAFPLMNAFNFAGRLCAKVSFKKVSPLEAVKKSVTPTLFMHGAADDFVPVFMGEKLFKQCSAPKKYVSVEGAIHARSYQTSAEQSERAVAEFVGELIDSAEKASA